MNTIKKNKYLFIAGCARSGTSALAQLVGNHSKIVMGMERYGHLVNKGDFKLTPQHFEPDHFMKIEPGDTFYDDFKKKHQWDDRIEEKLKENKYIYIGDKRPKLYEVYDELFETFPNAKVIFIYRNLYEVASSWNKRAEEGENWPAHKDFQKAVYTWNNSLKNTMKALEKYPEKIMCIRYEDIFIKGVDLKPLYDWLGLEVDEYTKRQYEKTLIVSRKLQENRKAFQLSEAQKAFCDEKAMYKLEKMLNKIKLFNN